MQIQKYNKALTAFAIPALFLALNMVGLTEQSTLKDVVTLVLTGLGVYAVPNRG